MICFHSLSDLSTRDQNKYCYFIMSQTLDQLPDELLVEVLLNLNIDNVRKFCRTNKRVAAICRDEYFWKTYANSMGIKSKIATITWKQLMLDAQTKTLSISFEFFVYTPEEARDALLKLINEASKSNEAKHYGLVSSKMLTAKRRKIEIELTAVKRKSKVKWRQITNIIRNYVDSKRMVRYGSPTVYITYTKLH